VSAWSPAVTLGKPKAAFASQIRGVQSNEEFRNILSELHGIVNVGLFADAAIRVGVRGSSTGDGIKYRPEENNPPGDRTIVLKKKGTFRQGTGKATANMKDDSSDLDLFVQVPKLVALAKNSISIWKMGASGSTNLLDFLTKDLLNGNKEADLPGPGKPAAKRAEITTLRNAITGFSAKWVGIIGRKCDVNLSDLSVIKDANNGVEVDLPVVVYPTAYP